MDNFYIIIISNAYRRRQRSFSDGDIDGDYKYLLDDQVVMALSLCAPVSFNHDKQSDDKQKGDKQREPLTTPPADLAGGIPVVSIGIEKSVDATKTENEGPLSGSIPDLGSTADSFFSVGGLKMPEEQMRFVPILVPSENHLQRKKCCSLRFWSVQGWSTYY